MTTPDLNPPAPPAADETAPGTQSTTTGDAGSKARPVTGLKDESRNNRAKKRKGVTSPDDGSVNEGVTRVVQSAYGVITETLQQGRTAAERFRQGDYKIAEAPVDIGKASARMLQLAGELTATTFDLGERLLKELAAATEKSAEQGEAPADRPAGKAPPPPLPDSGRLKLNVCFEGDKPDKAKSHTDSLDRPKEPTGPEDIVAMPLVLRSGGARIKDIRFECDLTAEGLKTVVTLPAGARPGFYHGLVFAAAQSTPLGSLTVELTA